MRSEARTARREPDGPDVVIECHALAELAADERLVGDRERDLARSRVAEATGAKRHAALGGDTVDVALVDDATVGMEEVERDRRAALLSGDRAIDDRGGRTVAVPERP